MPNISQEELDACKKNLALIKGQVAKVVEVVDSIPPRDKKIPEKVKVRPPLDIERWEKLRAERQAGLSEPEHGGWITKARDLSVATGLYLFPNPSFLCWEPMPEAGRDMFQVVFPGGGETSVTEAQAIAGRFASGSDL